jgi:nucleotide-binding universal stress UspA family protein
MIKRILIPVDFSETSRRAAKWGIDLADQISGEVLVVNVLDVGDLRVAMDAGLHGFETSEDVKRQVREWIEAQYAKIIPADAKNVRREIRRGIVEKELVAAIQQYKPDLIVMGSTGVTRRLPIGSKTEVVMRHSDIPVVVIRAR